VSIKKKKIPFQSQVRSITENGSKSLKNKAAVYLNDSQKVLGYQMLQKTVETADDGTPKESSKT
jgi:hypothetical protein